MRREIKLLFLGAGESGKSTIMKVRSGSCASSMRSRLTFDAAVQQFSLAYGKPFTDQERLDYRDVIYDNSLRSMQVVIDAFDMLGIDVPPELNEQVELVMSLGDEPDLAAPTGELLPDVAKALMALWAFEGAREAVDMAHEFQLNESVPVSLPSASSLSLTACSPRSTVLHPSALPPRCEMVSAKARLTLKARSYFNNIQRLAQPGYIPTDQDILRSRVKSTGITEVQLNIHGTVYRMCDVGGQRSERKKWRAPLEPLCFPPQLTRCGARLQDQLL